MGSHRLDIGHKPASVIVITLTPTIKMFSRFQKPVSTIGRQLSTSSVAHRNVAVMGASGGIGQPLSMLLKLNPAVTKLALYDIVHTPGVAADLSHIESKAEVTGFKGADQIEASLKDCEIVVIPAGVPQAWHDQRRSVQHQCFHDCHHLQPCQFYCSHCLRDLQEGWNLRPQESLWSNHLGCCQIKRLHWHHEEYRP